ncbi:hypothetical protein TcasGA2_TC011277 [Tribolium castaneum]|uniref:Uncharacterized protein n=1 Tax=Tribolium castaneum TaxID=7070 RepID=D6X3P2_TRICA|nr:hypothetical protein TcasGA2_TC011277 [Tribolium castaneum]
MDPEELTEEQTETTEEQKITQVATCSSTAGLRVTGEKTTTEQSGSDDKEYTSNFSKKRKARKSEAQQRHKEKMQTG